MTMTTRERRIISRSTQRKHASASGRLEKPKLRELLRQARMHVVEVRHAAATAASTTPISAAFLVRVDGVVALAQRHGAARSTASATSSGTLAHDGPMRDVGETNGGRRHRNQRKPGISTSLPNG